MEQNYLLWAIMLLTVLFKALADGYNYKFNVEKNETKRKWYGIIYHIFGVFSIGIPLMAFLVNEFEIKEAYIIIIGFACIYFGIFDILYNKVTGRNSQYIGKTDIIDIWLGKIFNHGNVFKKSILVVLRVLVFIIGTSLILDFI